MSLTDNPNEANIFDDGLGICECPIHVGCKTIPSYRTYCISPTGEIHTHRKDSTQVLIPQKQILAEKYDMSRGTYYFVRIIRDDGLTKNVQRHRMLLIAHKGFSPDREKTLVNHKNGIRGDDFLDNLEWASHSDNIKHAYENNLRPGFEVPVESWNLETGEKITYRNCGAFCAATNTPVGTMRKRLNKDNAMVYNGFRYRYKRDEWSETDVQYFTDRLKTSSRPVTVYDLRDGSFKDYPSAQAAAEVYGTTSILIAQAIRQGHLTPMNGCFFRDAGTEWFPQPTEHQLRLLQLQGYPDVFVAGCVLYKGSLENEVFIGTYEDAMEFLNLTATGSIRNAGTRNITVRGYAVAKIAKMVHPDDVIRRQP